MHDEQHTQSQKNSIVGDTLGLANGDLVGFLVGLRVGAYVGLPVGFNVGLYVGDTTCSFRPGFSIRREIPSGVMPVVAGDLVNVVGASVDGGL